MTSLRSCDGSVQLQAAKSAGDRRIDSRVLGRAAVVDAPALENVSTRIAKPAHRRVPSA
jgi:hypothetical protein